MRCSHTGLPNDIVSLHWMICFQRFGCTPNSNLHFFRVSVFHSSSIWAALSRRNIGRVMRGAFVTRRIRTLDWCCPSRCRLGRCGPPTQFQAVKGKSNKPSGNNRPEDTRSEHGASARLVANMPVQKAGQAGSYVGLGFASAMFLEREELPSLVSPRVVSHQSHQNVKDSEDSDLADVAQKP